jgi:O-antigen/teichoic acid export membrane protein
MNYRNININYYYTVMVKNILGSFSIKGLAMLLSVISLPAYINYFNDDNILGLWITTFSILNMLHILDFGIGNGLRNSLVIALAKKDNVEVNRIISSSYILNGIISLLFLILGTFIIINVDLYRIFNIKIESIDPETLQLFTLISFFTIIMQFLLKQISFVIYALQKSVINNMLSFITSVFQVVYVISLPLFGVNHNIIVLGAGNFLFINIPLLIATVIILNSKFLSFSFNISNIDINYIRNLFHTGSKFFLNQTVFTLIISINIYLITIYYSPADVVEYRIYYSIFTLLSTFVFLGLTPVWSLVTKAWQDKDYNWLYNSFNILSLIIGLLFLSQLMVIPFLQLILNLWLGDGYITADIEKSVVFALFGGIFMFNSLAATYASGLAKLRLQLKIYSFGLLSKLLIVYYLRAFIQNWVFIVIIDLCILLWYSIYEIIQVRRIFKSSIRNNDSLNHFQ